MATFAYTARKIDGSSVSGSLPAENERAALGALDRMGLFPIDLRREGDAARAPRGSTGVLPKPPGERAEAATTKPGNGRPHVEGAPRATGRLPAPGNTGRLAGLLAAEGEATKKKTPRDPLPALGIASPAPLGAMPEAEAEGDDALARIRAFMGQLLGTAIGAETAARFARELADLSAAGVPILKALDAVSNTPPVGEGVIWGAKEKKDDERARGLLREVRRDVSQGASLAEALGARPDLFGTTAVSLIRAGEAGGFLDQALRRVAVFAEREMALTRRVKGALAYPVLLSILSGGAVVFLLTWVVPRFAVMYADLGGDLPMPTLILMGIADALRNWWPLILIVVGGAGYGLSRALSTEEGKRKRDALLLRTPLLRAVIGQSCVARFCRTLGTLLASGVPILKALEIAQSATGNRDFSARLGDTLASLREGSGLAAPLRATRLFPPQVIEMIEVGQETGGLTDVLERAGERADEEVDQALRIFVTILEPALIVAVAAVVFFVVVAALLPVFSVNDLVR